jgi:hypothetical protein
MKLIPEKVRCPVDGVDLTELTRTQLGEEMPVGFGFSVKRRRIAAKPFLVLITCPGNGKSPPHDVTVSGEYIAGDDDD